MNFLAHCYLAGSDAALRVGGMMGDFVKGPLPAGLPSDLAAGVWLHRRIDSFTDAHPLFRRSRERVSPARRRYAGIMVDLFYDHFLASRWERLHHQPLAAYTAEVYDLLARRAEDLPERLAGLLPHMRGDDWLASYAEADYVGLALDRMAHHRLRQPNGLGGAVAELLADYQGFESDFLEFLPDVAERSAALAMDLKDGMGTPWRHPDPMESVLP